MSLYWSHCPWRAPSWIPSWRIPPKCQNLTCGDWQRPHKSNPKKLPGRQQQVAENRSQQGTLHNHHLADGCAGGWTWEELPGITWNYWENSKGIWFFCKHLNFLHIISWFGHKSCMMGTRGVSKLRHLISPDATDAKQHLDQIPRNV